MAIYLVCFLISSVLLARAERYRNKLHKKFVIAMAILIPAVLAGCRDSSIGTDVAGYGIRNFNYAHASSSFPQYFDHYKYSIMAEPLYHLLVYITSRFFDNYHWGLFGYNLLMVVFAYLGVHKYHKIMNTPIGVSMALYYLALYNISLNIMRQCIAVSIVFWATSYLFEEKYAKFAVIVLLGVGFHSSAIMGFLFWPMYLFAGRAQGGKESGQIIRGCLFLFTVLGVLFAGGRAVRFLVDAGILRTNYLNYLSSGAYASHRVSPVSVGIYAGYFLIYMCHYRHLNKRKLYSLFFAIISFIMLISMFGQMISVYISRAGYYFMPLQMISFANITNCYQAKSKQGWIFLIVLYSVIVWFIIFAYRGNHATVPYIFGPGSDR